MKRLLKKPLALIAACWFLFVAACAPTAAQSAAQTEAPAVAAEETAAPTPEPTAEPTPTPEPKAPVPIDLLSEAYNPFDGVAFPDGYTIYAARFDTADAGKGLGDRYGIYMTAAGDPAEIVRYIAGLLDVQDAVMIAGYEDSIAQNWGVDIEGAYGGGYARAQIKQTEAGYETDECTDVAGCRVELSADIDAERTALCTDFVLQNYSPAALGDLADRLSTDAARRDMLGIYVNLQKPGRTAVSVAFSVDDASALEGEAVTALQPNWHDEEQARMNAVFGPIGTELRFDAGSNIVYLTQYPGDNTVSVKAYALSDVSLTKLGFQFYPNDGLCMYEQKENGIEIALARPEWHRAAEDWNIEFLGRSNGYDLGMWYMESIGMFHISVTKGSASASCDYNVNTGEFSDGWPDQETMLSLFGGAAGSAEGDVRAAVFALFTDLVQQRFGVDWQTLYALPVW
ncbi:MAG: hypothetical protein GX417_10840 [Clostridiales bacterium]|nr:hypothetical protein [Clostridiales bacterium]